MKKILFSIATFLFVLAAVPTAVSASGESNCQIVYGGGEVCEEQVKFTINKMVQTADSSKGGNREYVENLTINDGRYGVNQNVNFKIIVENTGDRDIKDLDVVDTFPEFLTFVAGVGISDEGASRIEFTIGELKTGEKKEFVITAKTGDTPNNQSITCVTNNVKAHASDGSVAEDNAQVCIEKDIVEKPVVEILEKPTVEKIPATGPEMGILAALFPMGAAGIYLRRKFN